MKKLSLLIVLTLLGSSASADECETNNIRPDLYQQAQAVAKAARDRQTADHVQETTRSLQAVAQGKQQSLAKCLDKYKNISVAGALNVPSPMDLLRGALDRASSAVCSKVDDVYSDARRSTETRVALPGSLGGGSLGLPSRGALASPPPPPLIDSNKGILDVIRGIFR